MTFDGLKKAVKDYVNLTSQDADTRVGESLNRHYRRITSTLGLDASRFVTRSTTTTPGVQAVEFDEIEKIDRVLNTTDSANIRLLKEVELHQLRSKTPTTGEPCQYALRDSGASTVTVLLDTIPQSAYTLQADGRAALADLQGDDAPAFPESFHDILPWFVIAEELLKKEKAQLAAAYEAKANALLNELRFFLADSPTRETKQRSSESVTASSSGGGGGAGSLGATAYTQSALVTFDLGSGVAPFAVAQTNAPTVTNLSADELDGEDGTFYLDRANHTGTLSVTPADISTVTTDSLVGRDAAGTGVAANITLGGGIEFTGADAIRRSALTGDVTAPAGSNATTIALLAVSTPQLAADAVTDAKLRDSGACSVIGNSTNATANPADISASTNSTLLARVSNALSWVGGLVFDGANRIQQIAFAATQSASSDANTLDDYEEGSWTATDGSGAGLSLASVEGSYVKVGQLVTAACTLTYPATADGNTATIGGLPFTIQNTSADIYVGAALNSSGTSITVLGVHNTTTLLPRNTASFSTFTNANLSTLTLRFTLTYRATA